MVKYQDMGNLDGPVLLFGGPYSNLQAIDGLLTQALELKIESAQMICTGDVVAYCGDPSATTELMRNAKIALIAGNCERQLAAGAVDCGCGFEEGTACDILSAGWFSHAHRHISDSQREWMGALPDILSFRHAGLRYAVVHGGFTDIARFIWPTSDEQVIDDEWQAVESEIGPVDGIVAGHSGLPFVRETARGRWINAGVIGMPPHDGSVETRYMVLQEGELTLHRLSYDVKGAVSAMTQAGLAQGYHRSLETGYWPSEDVLPCDLRRAAFANG